MKKFIYFFALCAYAVGTIGGIGYACYSKAWFIAVCVAVLGIMAFPKAKEFFKKLSE
jgi:uncharacterized membrane protein